MLALVLVVLAHVLVLVVVVGKEQLKDKFRPFLVVRGESAYLWNCFGMMSTLKNSINLCVMMIQSISRGLSTDLRKRLKIIVI